MSEDGWRKDQWKGQVHMISRAAGLGIGYIVVTLLQEGWYELSIAENACGCLFSQRVGGVVP